MQSASILPAEKASMDGAVIEPDKVHVEAGVLEPAFLFGDLDDRVARPVAVTDLDGIGHAGGRAGEAGERESECEE